MSWKKAAAFATLAAISFTGNYLVSASLVTAKANETISANVPGGTHMSEWCDPSKFDRVEWITSRALRDLKLSDQQQALFDEVLAATKRGITRAETICSSSREEIHALPAPQQLHQLRAMLGEAERFVSDISGPFDAFYASLDVEQTAKFSALIKHDRGHGRWHRKG